MRFWTLEEASAALAEVRGLVQRLRALTAAAARARERRAVRQRPDAERRGGGRRARAVLADLTERGIVVRDPARGLIDFPAQSPTGREYLLCWLDGEDAIEWWHWPDAGFAGRTPLSEPPA